MQDENTLSEELLADFSETVRGVAQELDERGPVTASEIAWAIQRRHPEYGDGKFAEVRLDPEVGERDSMTVWLTRVRELYDPDKLRASRHQVVDGELTLIGLARLDRDLLNMVFRGGGLRPLLDKVNLRSIAPKEFVFPQMWSQGARLAHTRVLLELHEPIRTLSLSADGRFVALVAGDRLWWISVEREVPSEEPGYKPFDYFLSGVAVFEQRSALVVAGIGLSWLGTIGEEFIQGKAAIPSPVAQFTRLGGERAAAVAGDSLWRFDRALSEWTILGRGGSPIHALAGSPGGWVVATGHDDGQINFWDLTASPGLTRGPDDDRWPLDSIEAHQDRVLGLDLTADARIVSIGDDGALRMWRPPNLEPILDISSFDEKPVLVRFDPAGDRIAVGGAQGNVTILDALGDVIALLPGHTSTVTSIAWATDGTKLYTADFEGMLLAHDLAALPGLPSAHVDWIHDEPAERDVLKRKPLAALIALQLRELAYSHPGRSFLVHIDGPWGAGKSSLLNFLDDELKKKQDEPWLISRFDAWRQSKVGPPWLALTSALRETLRNDRSGLRRFRFRAREWARLAGSGRWVALALFVLIAGILAFLTIRFGWADPSVAQTAIGLTSGLAAIATLVWSMLKGTTGLLVNSSAKRARDFEESQRDPMDDIAKHFAWLLDRAGKTIVVFIDDLDRCKDTYVVELLDTLQTLMRTAPKVSGKRAPEHADESAPVAPKEPSLIFVVAADGRWIRKSYEKAHEVFIDTVSEPGRPLGYLFLEKLFQVTVELPTLSPSLQEEFLSDLLGVSRNSDQEAEAAREVELTERIQQSATEDELLGVLQEATPKERVKLSEVTVGALSKAPVRKETENALEKFAGLLEPNPRSMKRFVIAYSIARGVRTVEGSAIGIEPLALWIVIRSRWPAVADYIAQHPEAIELVGKPAEELTTHGVPSHLVPLFEDSDKTFARVIGFLPDTPLTADVVKECCGTADAGTKEKHG